jgi:hypothetical protein
MTTLTALLQAATPNAQPHMLPFIIFTLVKLIVVFTV